MSEITCEFCRERFTPGRHQNQHYKPGGKPIASARYCSAACKQAAYRWRNRGQNPALDDVGATQVLASVTNTLKSARNADSTGIKIAHEKLPPISRPIAA